MRKNRYLYLLYIILIFSIFFSPKTLWASKGIVYINIKEPIDYIIRLLPVEIGINYFLKFTKDPRIVPVKFAEDYSVWIRHYRKKKEDGKINISFILELRTRAGLFSKGVLLQRKKIDISYDKDAPIPIRIIIDKKTEKIIKRLGIDMDSVEREAFWVGTKITDEIMRMIKAEEE